MSEKGKIYLIPSLLAPETESKVLPPFIKEIILNTSLFFVENIRTTRRFISALQLGIHIQTLEFIELHKDTKSEDLIEGIEKILGGQDAGIISEAGCPGIADPGSLLVRLAHQKEIQVIPLVGASSILLALMASGFNGQSFAFQGYLPIDVQARQKEIQKLEKNAVQLLQTQIFMETPYRNNQLLQDLLKICHANTLLCIASNITASDELIQTKKIKDWKNQIPDLHKKPTIFLIGN